MPPGRAARPARRPFWARKRPWSQLVGYYAEWTSAGDENATQEIKPDFGANSVTARGITDNGTTETFQGTAVCLQD